jgi:glycosyltransferase involved in cell wall biosynthesis
MRLELGGVVRSILDWCTVLAARGNDVTLVTDESPHDIPSDWNGQYGKPKVVRIPPAYRPNSFVPPQSVRLWRNLLAGGAVAHLHCPWTASNLQMSRVARRLGVPYIVSIHGMLDDWSMSQRGWKKRLFLALGGRRYLRAADRLHYTAAAERQQAERWVPGAAAAVLPCMVDLAPFQSLPGRQPALAAFPALAGDDPKLLFLSRLHEKKGVHLLIDAAALLRQTGQRFKLLIAGAGSADYESQLRRQTQRLRLEDVVSFLGMVKGVEKISLYQAADLFVLPTQQENFGLVLIEALAAGTPVLTTRGTDIWQEIAAAGGTIIDNTPTAISSALGSLLDDRASLAAQGQRGRQWVLKNLDSDKLASDYESLYAQVVQEHSTAGQAHSHLQTKSK